MYTKELLIEELRYFAEYLGKTPTIPEVDNDTLMPCSTTYKNCFGSWNNALVEVGLKSNILTHTDVHLIRLLEQFAVVLGKTPTVSEIDKSTSMPCSTTYKDRFGSWNNAIIKAGLKPNCNQSHITEENLALSYNKEWLSKENQTKTLKEISRNLGYNKHEMSSRFKELGIKPILHKESLKEKEWLDSLGITERQYPIENYKVDGYDPETNTVYEFLGDYWHGNPEVYDPDDYNKSCSKTFGQLHNETIERLEHIKSLGYNIIIQWEKEWLI